MGWTKNPFTDELDNNGIPSVGSLVPGGTVNCVLYIDSSGNLACDSVFTYDGTTDKLSLDGLLEIPNDNTLTGGTDILHPHYTGYFNSSGTLNLVNARLSPSDYANNATLNSLTFTTYCIANTGDKSGVDFYGINGAVWLYPSASTTVSADSVIAMNGIINLRSVGTLNITDVYGVKIASSYTDLGGGGAITNSYAFYDNGGLNAESSNSWGLYSLSTKNYLYGSLGIGETVPTSPLHVKAASGIATKIVGVSDGGYLTYSPLAIYNSAAHKLFSLGGSGSETAADYGQVAIFGASGQTGQYAIWGDFMWGNQALSSDKRGPLLRVFSDNGITTIPDAPASGVTFTQNSNSQTYAVGTTIYYHIWYYVTDGVNYFGTTYDSQSITIESNGYKDDIAPSIGSEISFSEDTSYTPFPQGTTVDLYCYFYVIFGGNTYWSTNPSSSQFVIQDSGGADIRMDISDFGGYGGMRIWYTTDQTSFYYFDTGNTGTWYVGAGGNFTYGGSSHSGGSPNLPVDTDTNLYDVAIDFGSTGNYTGYYVERSFDDATYNYGGFGEPDSTGYDSEFFGSTTLRTNSLPHSMLIGNYYDKSSLKLVGQRGEGSFFNQTLWHNDGSVKIGAFSDGDTPLGMLEVEGSTYDDSGYLFYLADENAASKFTVDYSGNTVMAGALTQSGTSGANTFNTSIDVNTTNYISGTDYQMRIRTTDSNYSCKFGVEAPTIAGTTWRVSSASSNQKNFQLYCSNGGMLWGMVNDAFTAENYYLAMLRSGYSPTVIAFMSNVKVGFSTSNTAPNPSEIFEIATGNIFVNSDSNKLLLGAGKDMSVLYTGSAGRIDCSLIAASDLQIDCGTDKTIVLDETVWDDMLPYSINPGTGLTALTSADYGTTGFKWYQFSENVAANEEIQCFFQLPHSYKQGTDIALHLHVVPPVNGAAGDEDVEFSLSYQWVNIDGSYSTTTNTTVASTVFRVGSSDANKHKIWEFAHLSGSGKNISSDLMVRIKRLTKAADRVNDDYTDLVWLRFVDVHFEKDTIGSRQETAK